MTAIVRCFWCGTTGLHDCRGSRGEIPTDRTWDEPPPDRVHRVTVDRDTLIEGLRPSWIPDDHTVQLTALVRHPETDELVDVPIDDIEIEFTWTDEEPT